MIIGLSCGHGGPEHSSRCKSGASCIACGTKAGKAYGIVEAPFVRSVGDELIRCVDVLTGPGDESIIVLLNAADETVDVQERGARAREAGCDFVLSLHVNESGTGASGAHMLHRAGEEFSIAVATEIAKAWPDELKRNLHGRRAQGTYYAGMVEPAIRAWWPRAYALLEAYAPIPTVLVEMFYASRKSDCLAALDRWNRVQIVSALIDGIAEAGRIVDDNEAADES